MDQYMAMTVLETKSFRPTSGCLQAQVYLIGNPLVWWISTAGISLFVGLCLLAAIRRRRQFDDFYPG